MSDDSSRRRKKRSASICAPGVSSMEQMINTITPPKMKISNDKKERDCDSGSGTPDSNNTPTRKRRPAARSQSARVSGTRSIRRKATAQAAAVSHYQNQASGKGMRSLHCSSEPRLNDDSINSGIRRRNSRRGQSMHTNHHHRKSQAHLNVPDFNNGNSSPSKAICDGEESYRLRSFSLTNKGVVNRGDSFRRRRSRSNSLAPVDTGDDIKPQVNVKNVVTYTVGILGTRGVGKSALINQFMTSEFINAYERRDVPVHEQSVFVMLNGEESELKFIVISNPKEGSETEMEFFPDAFIIMYSIIDKGSFQKAEQYLVKLHDRDLLRKKSVIIVGNKIDLVRSRSVSSQDGKCLACTYHTKFIEISVGINHNVDDLLVGILSQIRLKLKNTEIKSCNDSSNWYRSRGIIRASMKARQMFSWLFSKEDSKFKNCENLHVL